MLVYAVNASDTTDLMMLDRIDLAKQVDHASLLLFYILFGFFVVNAKTESTKNYHPQHPVHSIDNGQHKVTTTITVKRKQAAVLFDMSSSL